MKSMKHVARALLLWLVLCSCGLGSSNPVLVLQYHIASAVDNPHTLVPGDNLVTVPNCGGTAAKTFTAYDQNGSGQLAHSKLVIDCSDQFGSLGGLFVYTGTGADGLKHLSAFRGIRPKWDFALNAKHVFGLARLGTNVYVVTGSVGERDGLEVPQNLRLVGYSVADDDSAHLFVNQPIPVSDMPSNTNIQIDAFSSGVAVRFQTASKAVVDFFGAAGAFIGARSFPYNVELVPGVTRQGYLVQATTATCPTIKGPTLARLETTDYTGKLIWSYDVPSVEHCEALTDLRVLSDNGALVVLSTGGTSSYQLAFEQIIGGNLQWSHVAAIERGSENLPEPMWQLTRDDGVALLLPAAHFALTLQLLAANSGDVVATFSDWVLPHGYKGFYPLELLVGNQTTYYMRVSYCLTFAPLCNTAGIYALELVE